MGQWMGVNWIEIQYVRHHRRVENTIVILKLVSIDDISLLCCDTRTLARSNPQSLSSCSIFPKCHRGIDKTGIIVAHGLLFCISLPPFLYTSTTIGLEEN